jgi:ABC-type transport system involved in cytochrome c biogenesis permease subunit
VHVVPTVAGIAALWSAAVLCAMYLLTERYLRASVLSQSFRWLPSLEALDRLAREALKLAVVLLSLGLAAGVIRALLYKELGSRWLGDPKVISALATWALVCGVLAAGRRGRFGGRRFAHLTLLAAALGAFTYIGVDALLGGRHAGL